MGQKTNAAQAGMPRARVYKPSPLLVKPGKRSRQEALPSALHMGLSVGLSLLVFAIINICVTELLGARNRYVNLVQTGTLMAMITVTVLGTPNLGNSFTKAAQRIAGVFIGGWLFYALYYACQEWWFLVICLTLFAFILVALSFALSGREYLFPVALVSAFVVACNFDGVKQALTMTIVKTVAFAGAIVLYTIISLLIFPLTATQQLLTTLASALKDIEQLADIVLVAGDKSAQGTEQTDSVTASKDTDAQPGADAAAATDDTQSKGLDAGNGAAGKASATRTQKSGKKGKKAVVAPPSVSVSLAANANHKLQLVQALLRMTKKEQYIGTFGGYRCFLPTIGRTKGVLPEEQVLAVVVNAGQVLRVLTTIMSDFGSAPIAKRAPPAALGPEAGKHLLPLAKQAVVALQDITAGLPVRGSSSYPVPINSLQEYAKELQQLVFDTVSAETDTQPSGSTKADTSSIPSDAATRGDSTGAASTVAERWKKAAVSATGMTLPGQRHHWLAAEFSALLSQSVSSEEGQIARWCSVLVLSRQLGRSIAGLNDSLNEVLAKLPWMTGGATI